MLLSPLCRHYLIPGFLVLHLLLESLLILVLHLLPGFPSLLLPQLLLLIPGFLSLLLLLLYHLIPGFLSFLLYHLIPGFPSHQCRLFYLEHLYHLLQFLSLLVRLALLVLPLRLSHPWHL